MKRGATHQARRVGAALLLAACVPSDGAITSATEALETTQSYDTYTTTLASSTGNETLPGVSTTDDTTESGGTQTTGEPTSGSTSTSTTSGTTDGDTSSGTTGQQIKTCKKLDILFFVDNTNEMWGAEYALQAMMPHLAERVESEFADWDYHMMVIKGDDTWGNAFCEQRCEQGGDPCNTDPEYPCAYEPNTCDLTLGAGVTFPAGGEAANVQCPIDGDQRYVTTGQSDLAGTLDCMRRTGYGYESPGKHEIVRSILDAIDEPLNAPGACNEGFFREDAYLILFVVSPLPDIYTQGTPEDWTKELKSHKGGKFDKIYFVGLFDACEAPFGKTLFQPMTDWVSSLYYHQLGHACTDDMIKYIDPALDYVQSDCQE